MNRSPELSQGDVVEYSYQTEVGEKTGDGTVCKSTLGEILLLPSESTGRMLIIKNGVVKRTHRGVGMRIRATVGKNAVVEPTGEQRDIEYVNQTGWVLTDTATVPNHQ